MININRELISLINDVITIICTFIFLLAPYFISLFTSKKLIHGAYGKSNLSKSNLLLKIGFVIWFSIIAYYVTELVIIDLKMKYITYSLATITIILFVSNIINEIKYIRKG